jgi:hypothetical protein
MKNRALSLSVAFVLLLSLFASCGRDEKPQEPDIVSDVNVHDASEAELRALIEQAAGQSAADFRYDDFDGDGTYEGSWMGTGHTYKRYYLYWTENGFKEYGGIAVSENKLSEYTGAREVLASIRQNGGRITGIYYRANGVININYRYNEAFYSYDCANVTLKVSGNSVSPVENIDCGGAFKAAFFPSIATYPKI